MTLEVELELQGRSVRGRLRGYWTAFSRTVVGDIFATFIALGAMAALFLASAFAVIGLSRAIPLLLRFAGAG